MEVHRVTINRKLLAAMPESERVLLLRLASASNEINVLTKLILMMRKDDPPSPILDHVESGQAFIIMRLLIGKLHESWELFKNRAQSNRSISMTYLPLLGAEATAALDALKLHFGAGSALSAIRNRIAFHDSDKENLTEASFQQLAASEPLQFYLTKTGGNSFYHVAELITQLAAINLIKAPPADPSDSASVEARAFTALCDVIIEVSWDITELFGKLIAALSEDEWKKIAVVAADEGEDIEPEVRRRR